MRIWDTATGNELRTIDRRPADKVQGGVVKLAFRPDSKRLAMACDDRKVRICDTITGRELLTLEEHANTVYAVSFSPDGRRLASAGSDRTVRLWDAENGKKLLTLNGHTDEVYGLSFSPDSGRLASTSNNRTVRVWDAVTGQELFALKGHSNSVRDVSFSPDGRRLASAGFDGTVRVWEALAVPDAVWRRRWLVSWVDSLFEELLFREEVLAALHNDPTLDEADRQFARDVAQAHSQQDTPSLNAAAWNVVKSCDTGKDAYARALRRAEAAVRLAPKDDSLLKTLGVAQYRVGRYADALATLTKSEKLNATKEGSLPSDLAFLAMTQHQLGKEDEAKATLGRLREVMKQPRWAQNAEAVGFLREAEELIEGKADNK